MDGGDSCQTSADDDDAHRTGFVNVLIENGVFWLGGHSGDSNRNGNGEWK